MAGAKGLRNALAILCLLGLTGAASCLLSRDAGLRARQSEASRRLDSFSAALFSPMDKYAYLPEITAAHPLVVDTLEHPGNANRTAALNTFLEVLNRTVKSAAVYVMDAKGMTIAASNWRERATFVGNNYSFRPYFQDAIAAGSGHFFGVGTVSLQPGYYLSHAVKSGGRILGVVAVKVDLGKLDEQWDAGQDHMVVTDENGIAFLSSRKDWKYRALRRLDDDVLRKLEKTQQYGIFLRPPILTELEARLDRGDRIVRVLEPGRRGDSSERRYFVRSVGLHGSNWEVSIFAPIAEVEAEARRTAMLATGTVTFLILLFMYQQQVKKRRRE